MSRLLNGPTAKVCTLAEQKGARCVELCMVQGKTYAEAAAIVGYAGKAGVAYAIQAYRDKLTKQTLEIVERDRERIVAHLERIVDKFLPLIDSLDEDVDIYKAADTAMRALREWSRLRGIETVIALKPAEEPKREFDARALPAEDLATMRGLLLKMSTVETTGHDVTEPKPKEESHEPEDHDEA